MTALLVLIYVAFISLGIPDSLLGATWPAMHGDVGATVPMAGLISMVVSCGTVVSSMASTRLINRFGTAKVTACSVLMTALALLGISAAGAYWMLLLCAVPLGLGAGAVDSALNNYVALHYKAKHMNWLHCFWGIGATLGPVLMGLLLRRTGSWRLGYSSMGWFQLLLSAVLVVSLPLWQRAGRGSGAAGAEPKARVLTLGQTLRIPLALPTFSALLLYCGAESTMNLWTASFLVSARGMGVDQAATVGALFFVGITLGRFASGLLSAKWTNTQMIGIGQACAAAGVALLLLPLPSWLLQGAIFLTGLGFAPIYPSVLHQTPKVFGEKNSQAMMGVQMALAYVGSTLVPPLFGWLSSWVGLSAMPVYVGALVLGMVVCNEYVRSRYLARDTGRKQPV